VDLLPTFTRDTTDRNRTSPFAFTGNKFEFRMPGSTQSIAGINFIINAIVAESLCQFADRLEAAKDFDSELTALIQETVRNHKRIIFNGNNYSEEWVEEAQKRGLSNLKTAADCLPYFVSDKNIALFTKHKILTEAEMHSRLEIMLEAYSKALNIEALTMVEMAQRDILPAVISYSKELSDTVTALKSAGVTEKASTRLLREVASLADCMQERIGDLESVSIEARTIEDAQTQAAFYAEQVFQAMQELRSVVDELETMMPRTAWPMPTYGDILYYV
jgi:glutamine synthetase